MQLDGRCHFSSEARLASVVLFYLPREDNSAQGYGSGVLLEHTYLQG
jgi:hypothetical protein